MTKILVGKTYMKKFTINSHSHFKTSQLKEAKVEELLIINVNFLKFIAEYLSYLKKNKKKIIFCF
jgi:hypothetical protein